MSLYSIALATFLVGTSQHFGVSSTVSSPKVPYEDDPQNFEHQHATGLLCSNYTYYMLNRTYKPPVPSECISVNVTSGLRNGTYQVLLRHRFNRSSEISSMNITVRPFTSGSHTEDNALLFNISAQVQSIYKFMYINSNKTCAVLRATHQQNGTGCELFSADAVPPPSDCKNVYTQYCPNTTSVVWKDDCKRGRN
uniref:Putative salivary lipocalin n=1 Tax=Ixodes ricinus TaxID=34613 RepID=A0A147BX71_IXORI